MTDVNCIFCKISSGKIPAKVVSRNSEAIAILDAFPLVPGHTLVISRSHLPKLQQLSAEENRGLFELASRVTKAIEGAMRVPATTIAIHNGREAGQEIAHLHVHIIPRKNGDGAGPVHSMFRSRPQLADQELEDIRAKISSLLPAEPQ